MSASKHVDRGRFGNFINSLEETFIALLLGLMVLVTFANVYLRYGQGTWITDWPEALFGTEFPTSILWGQDVPNASCCCYRRRPLSPMPSC